MKQTEAIHTALKRIMRSSGRNYAQAARVLKLSEASVKRLLSRSELSLERLEILARLPGYRATLDTNFTRHIWHWRPDADTHVEIMLDRGSILAGGREDAICEFELELVAGAPERLFDLAAHLGAIAPLFPCLLSKATRGSLLLAGKRNTLPTTASSPRDCAAAFATQAQACLDHISINLPANCSSFDAENLHQVRVGMRRLRALLQLFRPALRKDWCRKLVLAGAREHMRAIAPARNLHVLIDEILAPAAGVLDPRVDEHGDAPGHDDGHAVGRPVRERVAVREDDEQHRHEQERPEPAPDAHEGEHVEHVPGVGVPLRRGAVDHARRDERAE